MLEVRNLSVAYGGLRALTDVTLSVADTGVGMDEKVRERISGETVGILSATDQDASQTHTFAVDDARFEVSGTLLKLKDGWRVVSKTYRTDVRE